MTYIYFIQCEGSGRIKIGVSLDPPKRLAYLQVGSASKLNLVAVIEGSEADERQLHEKFSDHRVAGEWFEASPSLLAFVATLPAVERRAPKCAGSSPTLLAAALGVSKAHASRLLNGVGGTTDSVAARAWNAARVKLGRFARLSDDDCDTFARLMAA